MAAGFFQLDVWCLGAKDMVFKELSRSEFEDQMQDLAGAGRMVDIDPACARKLVGRGVAEFRPWRTPIRIQVNGEPQALRVSRAA